VLRITSARALVRDNRDPVWQRAHEDGLVLFGSGPAGDGWAIDVRRGERVVLLAHDAIWGEQVDSARGALTPVARSLSQALEWAEQCALPIDYYEALDLNERLKRSPKRVHQLLRMAQGRGANLGYMEVAVPARAFFAAVDDPRLRSVAALLKRVRARPEVSAVLVRTRGLEPRPRAEAVYVLARASLDDVASWLAPAAPSRVEAGWTFGRPDAAAPKLARGTRVVSATWS